MARTVWIVLGAAGGVLAYRKGQQLVEEARQRGVVGSVYAASESAGAAASSARDLLQRGLVGTVEKNAANPVSPPATGAAAARALAEAQRAGADKPRRTQSNDDVEKKGKP